MRREYRKWFSPALGREMELLVFGQDGHPVIVFPTARGRFYEFEDQGMVSAVADKIEGRKLQLFCVDSVDAESWCNGESAPRERIARQMQYERYLMDEVTPLARREIERPHLGVAGCGLGGYQAVNLSLRHPKVFTGCLSMNGVYDLKSMGCLDGYYDEDCYFNLPMDYLPNLSDAAMLSCMRHNNYVLATGVQDPGWRENEQLAASMRAKRIPVRLDVWGDHERHDWTCWQRMAQIYL